jgi:hypothetical protein
LIDLVTFGTLLRDTLLKHGIDIAVIAPTSMKLRAAMLTYPPIQKGKKTEYRNKAGVSGGGFSKHDMLIALLETPNYESDWQEMLRSYEEELSSLKNIPKPIEDLNDAVWMYCIVQEEIKKNQEDYKKILEDLRRI